MFLFIEPLQVHGIQTIELKIIRLLDTVAPVDGSTDIRPLESADEPITPAGTSYCYVLRPELNADDYPQHAVCSIPRAAPADDGETSGGSLAVQSSGLWSVVAGLDGQTDETQFTVNVAAKGTRRLSHF